MPVSEAAKLFTLLPTLQFQFPSLLSNFAAGHLLQLLLPLCPHCRELSRSSAPAFPPHHIPLSNPQTPRQSLPGNPKAICQAVNQDCGLYTPIHPPIPVPKSHPQPCSSPPVSRVLSSLSSSIPCGLLRSSWKTQLSSPLWILSAAYIPRPLSVLSPFP